MMGEKECRKVYPTSRLLYIGVSCKPLTVTEDGVSGNRDVEKQES